MNIIDTTKNLKRMFDICNEINNTNSTAQKQAVLSEHKDDEYLRAVLRYTYNPLFVYGLTMSSVTKYDVPILSESIYTDLCIFDDLRERRITGRAAAEAFLTLMENITDADAREMLTRILDRSLKIRLDARSINKVFGKGFIPEFNVSLCNVYADVRVKPDFEHERWYVSRKLDGCRCLVFVDSAGNARAFSRQGKEFLTLDVLLNDIENLCRERKLTDVVFDGEVCILTETGDEDFQSIMKEIRRKDHTIEKPFYFVFDLLTSTEFSTGETERTFSDRQYALKTLLYPNGTKNCVLLRQDIVERQSDFERTFKEANANGWEGLVLRKDDTEICRRSNSMLKCKAFTDAEYVVKDVEFGTMRIIENGREVERELLANIIIEHKGNSVGVGSGFSQEERAYYYEHPEEIIGKTVTVKYFEETVDKNGKYSLRFPVVKTIYENGRNV